MADDKELSEKILTSAQALQQWEEMEPFVNEMKSVVQEYSKAIDIFGQVFGVIGAVWDIYSDMENAKREAAQQRAMVSQIINAVDAMITRAVTEISQQLNKKEVGAAITRAKGIEDSFRLNVLPYVKSYPITGFDTSLIDNLRDDATKTTATLRYLIEERAKIGDGPAIMILYRNMHTLVQCKLMMDMWRHTQTRRTIETAEVQTMFLVETFAFVLNGFICMSDRSFSQGVVHLKVGGVHGRPGFNQYSYLYNGKKQTVKGSKWAPVAQAFVEARKAARTNAVPEEVQGWAKQAYNTVLQLRELKDKMPA